MKSQSSLPIQYRAGTTPDIFHKAENGQSCNGVIQEQPTVARTSFPSRLNESIIDVYERVTENAAVPDQRTGIDRRKSSVRQQASPELILQKLNNKVADIDFYSIRQKASNVFHSVKNTVPVIFSPAQKKGKFIDIWV